MPFNDKLTIALVGLSFGAEFAPIYLHHPDVESVVLCDSNPEKLAEIGDRFGIERRVSDLQDALQMADVDAVHLVTPIYHHASGSVAVLDAGKHCACTVPVGLSLDEVRSVVEAQRRSGKNYMMMETAVYTREFLWVQDKVRDGQFGRLQFLRGAHHQNLEGWPDYWRGLPPMHYMTHAISPLLALTQTRAAQVACFGSGRVREELRVRYDCPFAFETALFQLEDSDLVCEVTRFLYDVIRSYNEAFHVYGDQMSFEWQQLEEELPVVFRAGQEGQLESWGRGRYITAEHTAMPDFAHRLPPEIARFTQHGVYDESNPHLSFLQGGGHGGSHPHLAHEFVRSIMEQRKPSVDAVTAADWTAAGLCAHQSALRGGEMVTVPRF